MCAAGEAPAPGLTGATGALGAFGELGAGCDGGGMGLGFGGGCCARSGGAIKRIRAKATQPMDVLVTGARQILLAIIYSPDFLLTDY
jgi:hypothetical protein